MTALTAHLADRVRHLLAWDHELCRAVTAVFLWAEEAPVLAAAVAGA